MSDVEKEYKEITFNIWTSDLSPGMKIKRLNGKIWVVEYTKRIDSDFMLLKIEGNDELYKLDIVKCNRLFGIKDTRQPKVSQKYSDSEYGTLKEPQGIQEIVRLEIYNYLSGRSTHKQFMQFYETYQTKLYNIYKNNVQSKKCLNISLYSMPSGNYELTTYIN